MPRIQKLPAARQDLIKIWRYTFDQWGDTQADLYLDDLEEAIRLLAQQPLLCRERTELNPPVRIHHHQHHLIVYILSDNGIVIVRVLHERMDIEAQLKA